MIRLKWVALCLTASAVICGDAFAQVVPDDWIGTTNSFNTAVNWTSDSVPGASSVMFFSQQFATGLSGNNLTMDAAGNVSGIDVESFSSMHGNISIIGASTLTLGASGIAMDQTDMTNSSVAFISAPLALSANQTWNITSSQLTLGGPINGAGFSLAWNVNGSGIIDNAAGAISGAGTSLTISNPGGLMNVAINTATSTFTGGVTVTGGAGTILVVGANSTGSGASVTKGPLGTGTLTLGNGVSLVTPATTTFTVGNNIVIGNGGGPSTVNIEGGIGGDIILTGSISDGSGPGTIQAVSLGAVDFEGANTYSGGTVINFTTATIGTDTGLGTGSVTASNSTLDFNSFNPGSSIPSFSFNQSTVNFNHAGADPFLNNLSMLHTTLNFSPGSTIIINDMVSDSPGSGNVINIANGSALTLNENGTTNYYGTIDGPISSGVSAKSASSGVLNLFGNNTYRGGTTVSNGALAVADNNNAFGTGNVSVNANGALGISPGFVVTNQITLSGGTVGGYGTYAPAMSDTLDFQVSGFISGGKGTLGGSSPIAVPGALTFGANANLTLGPGGTMQFSIMNATAAGIGVAGTDYSTINAPNSTVAISATVVSPFTIQLVSVNPATTQLGLANFDPTHAYQWTLLSAGTLGGFASNEFIFDTTTEFQNSLAGGAFSIAQMGNNLVLDFTPVPEPSTWAMMATGLCALGAAVRRRR